MEDISVLAALSHLPGQKNDAAFIPITSTIGKKEQCYRIEMTSIHDYLTDESIGDHYVQSLDGKTWGQMHSWWCDRITDGGRPRVCNNSSRAEGVLISRRAAMKLINIPDRT